MRDLNLNWELDNSNRIRVGGKTRAKSINGEDGIALSICNVNPAVGSFVVLAEPI